MILSLYKRTTYLFNQISLIFRPSFTSQQRGHLEFSVTFVDIRSIRRLQELGISSKQQKDVSLVMCLCVLSVSNSITYKIEQLLGGDKEERLLYLA